MTTSLEDMQFHDECGSCLHKYKEKKTTDTPCISRKPRRPSLTTSLEDSKQSFKIDDDGHTEPKLRDDSAASSPVDPPTEETEDQLLDRIGRERPAQFKSFWHEFAFVFSILMSQLLTEYFVGGFNIILPSLSRSLSIPPSKQTWPASTYPLVSSCFLLAFGRLADIHGGYIIYNAGIAWLAIWSLVAGLSQNEIMLDLARAIQGLGPAAYLPASVMLLGSAYRPGPRKNVVFAVYGACSPLGFYLGIFCAGIAAEYANWRWYFIIGSILAGITAAVSFWCIPRDKEARRELGVKMDWLGAATISAGLILVVFAITGSAAAPSGWGTPYIIVAFTIGVLLLALAVFIEGWIAEMPLLPPDLFAVKYMKPLILGLFFFYGVLGTWLFYTTLYMTDFMNGTPLKLVAWFSPLAIGGILIATTGGFFLHLISGTMLVLISGISWVAASLIFAVIPLKANYWTWVFPAMLCGTIGLDITFTVTSIFISTSMPLKRQGLAGALINSLVQLSIAVVLGAAALIREKVETTSGQLKSYKAVFWFTMACAIAAWIALSGFVRIPEARSEMTIEEREAALDGT